MVVSMPATPASANASCSSETHPSAGEERGFEAVEDLPGPAVRDPQAETLQSSRIAPLKVFGDKPEARRRGDDADLLAGL